MISTGSVVVPPPVVQSTEVHRSRRIESSDLRPPKSKPRLAIILPLAAVTILGIVYGVKVFQTRAPTASNLLKSPVEKPLPTSDTNPDRGAQEDQTYFSQTKRVDNARKTQTQDATLEGEIALADQQASGLPETGEPETKRDEQQHKAAKELAQRDEDRQ